MGALLALVLALGLLAVFFPWDLLRGPLNRYVSEKTGRHFEITRRLDVKLGRTTRVLADGIVFANPSWAKDGKLVSAERGEIDVRLWPLLHGNVELPRVALTRPVLGLEVARDGRRSWDLDREGGGEKRPLEVGALVVDNGDLHYLDAVNAADIRANFAMDNGTPPGQREPEVLPMRFDAKGRWHGEPFAAKGQTGNVLSLRTVSQQQPFPANVMVTTGATSLQAQGAIASIARLEGVDVQFKLQGANLAQLYTLTGVVLPETPHYSVAGRLQREGEVWKVSGLQGLLGHSDIAGSLALDRSNPVPHLTGEVQSKLVDFNDLAPLVGMPEQKPVKAAAAPATPADVRQAKAARRQRDPGRKVLPTASLDVARLKAMSADVHYTAARMTNVEAVPLDRMAGRIRLDKGVLLLDPLDLGFAGGRLAGRLRIDSSVQPPATEVALQARGLQLDRLFPKVDLMRNSFGQMQGEVDLKGRGATVAQMLGTANGDVALLMGQGQISNLLLEFAGLDGGEIIKFLMGHDQRVQLRCAAAAFDVKNGLMGTRALLLDTIDTVVRGTGTINLATEEMNLGFKPQPKDMSILSLRTPLQLAGTLGAPKVGVDAGPLAGRAGLALALGAINPLLALAATIETGPGKDADCDGVLRAATTPQQRPSATDAATQQAARQMGASGRP